MKQHKREKFARSISFLIEYSYSYSYANHSEPKRIKLLQAFEWNYLQNFRPGQIVANLHENLLPDLR